MCSSNRQSTLVAMITAMVLFALPAAIASAQTHPGERSNAAMAYDSIRQNIVLFGGQYNDESVSGETWLWDGSIWTLAADTGPGPRYRHAMAFDESRGKVVLFGGQGDTDKGCCVVRDDTWEWDGNAWELVNENLSASSQYPIMAYDADNQVILMTAYQDTWAWDGASWTEFADENTPDLFDGAAMAYDRTRGNMVLVNNEGTWEWNGTRWNRASSTPVPTSLYGGTEQFSMTHDDAAGEMLLFGGRERKTMVLPILFPRFIWYLLYDRALDDTLSRRSGNWRLINDPCPGPRFGHAMAYDSEREVAVVYGGRRVNGLYVAICDNFLENCVFEIEQSVDSWDGSCTAEEQGAWDDDTWEWNGQSWNLADEGDDVAVAGSRTDFSTDHAATLRDATGKDRQLIEELAAIIDRCGQCAIGDSGDSEGCMRRAMMPILDRELRTLTRSRPQDFPRTGNPDRTRH